MLTGDLVRARVKGRDIAPALVDPDSPRLLDRAGELLAVMDRAEAEGWTRGAIVAAFREVEGLSTDTRMLRGMAKVLLDPCTFDTEAPVDPVALRARVFRAAARRGPLGRRPGARPTAAEVLAEVAAELAAEGAGEGGEDAPALDGDALAGALYADLKDEQRLLVRKGPRDPRALVDRYNLALVQALLLRTARLDLRLPDPDPKRVRQLLRYLKFFELMFRARWRGDELVLAVDGPRSILSGAVRYGRQLATFFPAVALHPRWRLEAEVHWGRRNLRKRLVLDQDAGLRSHFRDTGVWRSRAELFFEERFRAAETGWTLEPGRMVIRPGQDVVVPDFTLRRDGRVAHLDIVGTWRRAWLRRHLADLPDNVILAVSRRLAGEGGGLPDTLRRQVVEFAEIVPVGEVLRRAEAVARPEGATVP